MGLTILGLLTIQPFTELLNHFLYSRYPRVIYIGYVHIAVGRVLIAAGLIQGGLGFAYSAKIDREMPMRPGPWPLGVHVAYGVVAGIVGVAYAACVVWKQMVNMRRMDEGSLVEEGGGDGDVMMHRLEEHALSDVRATVRKASESAPGVGNSGGGPVAGSTAATAGGGALSLVASGSDQVSVSSALGESSPSPGPNPLPARMSSIKKIFKSDAL